MAAEAHSERVLVWAPRGRDADLAASLLARAGYSAQVCSNVNQLCQCVEAGAACVVVTEEALAPSSRSCLAGVLQRQPPWSDLPFIVFTQQRGGAPFEELGNVTLLDRPVNVRTLVSAVRSALRARKKQYEARQAIVQRDQFLAMLGHELRNPLGAIVLAAELLSDGNPRHRTIIDRQARHLSRLVDDLLDVSRVTTGKVNLQRAPIDLNELLRRTLQSMEVSVRGKSLHVEFCPDERGLVVNGDSVRLEQVFNNLLTNAIKYSPPGSQIRVITDTDGSECQVHVQDTGIGIAPNMLRRVFDLFAQAEWSLDRSQGGMGIGLTLVRTLVELHGGRVEATSPGLGQGSSFVVHLPLAELASLKPVAPRAESVEPRRPLRIVLVEDNADIRETTGEVLEALGCNVHTATDGPSGLAKILHQRPDAALIDIGLPQMDGYAIAQKVRGSLGPSIVLAAMTGYGQDEDRAHAHSVGFDEHLTKPVTARALQDLLVRISRR